jgi:flagellar basal-body rod modification protein FlgD
MAVAATNGNPALPGGRPPTAAESASVGLGEDFSTFLTLLTTQLQNQDPLDPTDSNEFTNQIVNFTGVEQQIRTNQNLETIATLSQINNLANSANYIGQEALIEKNTGLHTGDGLTFQYFLENPEGISSSEISVEIEITNGRGDVVHTETREGKGGANYVIWDGLDENGEPLPDAEYGISVKAETPLGDNVEAFVLVQDKITAVETITGSPVYVVGPHIVSQDEILRLIAPGSAIFDPSTEFSMDDLQNSEGGDTSGGDSSGEAGGNETGSEGGSNTETPPDQTG